MKTIKEITEKWNAMYELVIGGCTSVENTIWQKMQKVFMITDGNMAEAYDLRRKYIEDCDGLTEDDVCKDKDIPIHMKFIGDLLSLSNNKDYAFYIYNGEVGVLCEIDDKTIKAKGYESFNGIAFIPGYDIEEVLAGHLDTKPHLTNDDVYSGYTGCCDIDVQECRCIENEQHMELNWWTDAWAKSDEFGRMFGKTGEFTCKLRERMDEGEIDEQEARKLWEEEQRYYEDPVGCDDYSFDFIFSD